MKIPVLCLVGASVTACAVFGLFALSARAPDQSRRLEALRAQAQSTPRNQTRLQLPVTICRAPLPAAVATASNGLKRRALEAGLSIEALNFAPLTDLLPSDVVGAKLVLKVSGDEAGLTRFLKTSAAAQESIFIDRSDVAIGAHGVEAELQGRLLCRRGL